MNKNKRLSIVIASLIFLCAFQSIVGQDRCAPPVLVPNTGEPNIFTPEQEVFLGEAMAESIMREYKVIEAPELLGFLNGIGERLIANLPIKMRLQFYIVDLSDANAFVLPGGRIYVSRKLIAAAQSEDELAGVMAHELGHLATHETAIDYTRLFKSVLSVTQVTDRRDVFDKYNQLFDNFNKNRGAFKRGDREKGQLNADQAGMFALAMAGYDPSAVGRFWDRLVETKGKTGGWLSDLFGTTRPEERRLREMVKAATLFPSDCIKSKSFVAADFKQWQASVIEYSGLGRRENLHGVIKKVKLSPPLLSDINHVRFSLDGKFVLAQDDNGISVLTREPFEEIFRINADGARPAKFSPDASMVVFSTEKLRVERWSVQDRNRLDAREVVTSKGCAQTELSPDGKTLACLDPSFTLKLFGVGTGEVIFQKKDFFKPTFRFLIYLLDAIASRAFEDGDVGLNFINMSFSPDCKYFAAGFHFYAPGAVTPEVSVAEAFDLTKRTSVSLGDAAFDLISGGFSFVDANHIVGVHPRHSKQSGVAEFPKGKMISEYSFGVATPYAPTRGDYFLLRPMPKYPLGVMDAKTKVVFRVSEKAAMDIYDDIFAAELRNGELGLFTMEKNKLVSRASISNSNLGDLRVAQSSPDLNLLAISSRSRGGVWRLSDGESLLSLRAFRGAYLDNGGTFAADFPKFEEAERNIAIFDLKTGNVTQGDKIDAQFAQQIGGYLFTIKSAKTDEKDAANARLDRNVIYEATDILSKKSVWTRTFPGEAPSTFGWPGRNSLAFLWNVTDDTAKETIKKDPALTRQLQALKEMEGDYLLEVLDFKTGELRGRLLIETGKGSFRFSNVFAVGDQVIVTDSENRILVYSLSTGELKGRVFGAFATVTGENGFLIVENEKGKIAIYDLQTMEKKDELVFTNSISAIGVSDDGKRGLIITSDQTAYVLNLPTRPQTSASTTN